MANDERMIAIVIGVAGSVPPKYLSGALNSAHAFGEWASRQGYETVLVTDKDGDVTISLLRDKIEDILRASPEKIHRIIVYFAGHGLIREIEEGLWLLSDWRAELRAVAVEVLRRRLSMYGPRQVCIISDACRSLPSDVEQADLVPDAVLGAGPGRADPTIALDKFIAAQDGTEAFMIPGENPEDDRCLFSGVLVEGLWGLPGLKEKPFSKLLPDRVTSRSLGAYLLAEVPARAKEYGITLTPTISPTLPEGDDYYFSKDLAVAPPTFPPWPPKGKFTGMRPPTVTYCSEYIGLEAGHTKPAVPIEKSILNDFIICLEDGKKVRALKRHLRTRYNMTPDEYRRRWGLRSDYPMVAPAYGAKRLALGKHIGLGSKPAGIMRATQSVPARPGKGAPPRVGGSKKTHKRISSEPPRILDQLREQMPDPAAGSGIAVSGDEPRLWLGKGVIARRIGPGSWSIRQADADALKIPAPMLIEFSDGRFAATVALPRFFASLVRDEYGVTGIVYRNLEAAPDIVAPTEKALAALQDGTLRVDSATDLAAQLREFKHVEPVFGVISAYLYDAIGDIDSIRRIASFYARYDQAIPYDIALLAGLYGEKTRDGFVVEVPEVNERDPRTDVERQHPWTHCRMEARTGLVGGLWPWMRQGWVFLDDPSDVGSPLILPGLVELRSGLMRSRFATFEKDAALTLAHLCDLKPSGKHALKGRRSPAGR